eukprot:1189978-Prorocentrum_minimum.AAC.1
MQSPQQPPMTTPSPSYWGVSQVRGGAPAAVGAGGWAGGGGAGAAPAVRRRRRAQASGGARHCRQSLRAHAGAHTRAPSAAPRQRDTKR